MLPPCASLVDPRFLLFLSQVVATMSSSTTRLSATASGAPDVCAHVHVVARFLSFCASSPTAYTPVYDVVIHFGRWAALSVFTPPLPPPPPRLASPLRESATLLVSSADVCAFPSIR